MSEWSVRPVEKRDVPAVVDLLDRSLGRRRSVEEFLWKHWDNPFGRSPCLLAEAGGQPIAVRAFLRWRWRTGRREVQAVRAVDTATHPEWRRRGLFSELTGRLAEEMREAGVAFVFNTPGRQSRDGYLKLGWQPAGRAPLLVKPLRPARMALGLLGQASRKLTDPGKFAAAAKLFAEPDLADWLAAADGVAAHGEVEDRRFTTSRSLEYLRWRYAAAPGHNYRAAWQPVTGGSGAAILFHERLRRGLLEMKLSELLLWGGPEAEAAAGRLLGELAAAGGDYLVACAAPRTRQRRVLRQAGWLPAGALGPRLVARVLAGRASPDPSRPESWRLSLGDLEIL